MNNFFDLVGFEYKKIIKRKSFIIALVIMLFASTFCMIGQLIMAKEVENGETISEIKYQKIEKEILHNSAGYIDDKMISEIIEKNVVARDKIDENGVYDTTIYNSNIRPYNSTRSKLARVLSPIEAFDFEIFDRLDSAKEIDFYELRTKSLNELMELKKFNTGEKETVLKLNTELETPFYTDYYGGYIVFLVMMSTTAVFIIFALSICIAPIFADEFQKKTDAVILSSKYGKSRLITAKIFTALTFSLIFTVIALVIAVVTVFSAYSITGVDVSFQVWELFSVYPLTMAKAILIYCGVIVCVSLLISAICLALSSRFSSFATITALMLLLVGGVFIDIPNENLRLINFILPAKMLDSSYVFSDRLVSIFGMHIKPYVFIPILCFLAVATIIPMAYKFFKNHQVE